jgi:hypothetical protein
MTESLPHDEQVIFPHIPEDYRAHENREREFSSYVISSLMVLSVILDTMLFLDDDKTISLYKTISIKFF